MLGGNAKCNLSFPARALPEGGTVTSSPSLGKNCPFSNWFDVSSHQAHHTTYIGTFLNIFDEHLKMQSLPYRCSVLYVLEDRQDLHENLKVLLIMKVAHQSKSKLWMVKTSLQ